jgi:hypothetical protein
MLRSTKKILGYRVQAADDSFGKVGDFYFDDLTWTIRYLVLDTGKWLPGRQVLISPAAIGEADWMTEELAVSLTKKQVEDSPSVRADLPVSRQHEIDLARHFHWVPYWEPTALSMGAGAAVPVHVPAVEKAGQSPQQDPHLRSVKEVTGYHIEATDDKIGHVEDFIVETDDWIIRYMVVDTRNVLPGKKVLVSPTWIERVDWADKRVYVHLTAAQIKGGPEYDPGEPVNREYEIRLYDYYGRPKYW